MRSPLIENKARDNRLDKARIVLIWLVVFGHMIKPFLEMHAALGGLYSYIYSLHMPAFVMLAGMTSKAELTPKALRSLGAKLVAPLIIFSVLYEVFHYALNGEVSSYIQEGAPYWILWFLLSLFVWRLSLPYLLKLQRPITLSVILACIAGFSHTIDQTLSLSRTLYFLPFFLIGHGLYSGRLAMTFDQLMQRISLRAAAAWMIALAGILYVLSPFFIHQMFYGSLPYSDVSPELVRMMLMRLTLLCLSGASAICLIRVCASAPTLPAIYPHNTLWVYLWHGFIIIWIAHILDAMTLPIGIHSALAGLIVIACAVISWGLCVILSQPRIAQGSNMIIALPGQLINRMRA